MDENYRIVSEEDTKEIDDLLEFTTGLVIKNQYKAEELETIDSYRNSNLYITTILGVNDKLTEKEKETIINNYIELNPYYKELKDKYDINFFDSRMAKHLEILTYTNRTLSKEDLNLFFECYYQVVNYYNKVIYTQAFSNQTYNDNFNMLFIIFATVQKYLTRKMENFYNVDVYSLRTLKNAFISVGLDYFDGLPINYQRRILKMVNTLISTKGTNECINNIVELFGFNNTNVFKYILAKGYNNNPLNGKIDYNNPYLLFLKTPADNEVNFTNDIYLNFDSITANDPYWQVNKEEIMMRDFNIVNTKYMSIDTTINAMEEIIGLSYFMSLLHDFQSDYKEKEGKDFAFINKKISSIVPVNIFDAIVALQSLLIKSHGYKDRISKNPDHINYVYGYNNSKDKAELKSIIENINKILLDNNDKITNYNEVIDFFKVFKIKKFEEKDIYSLDDFIEVFKHNQKMRRKLEDLIITTDNYELYRNYQKIWNIEMRSKINVKLFKGYETFSEYLYVQNYELYKFITPSDIIINNEEKLYNFYKDRIFVLIDSISNFLGDLELREYFINNNFIGISDYIERYMYILLSIFKAYTIDLLPTNIILLFKNKKDNTVKLLDNYYISGNLSNAERVDLMDIMINENQLSINENDFNLQEKIKITISEENKEDIIKEL